MEFTTIVAVLAIAGPRAVMGVVVVVVLVVLGPCSVFRGFGSFSSVSKDVYLNLKL